MRLTRPATDTDEGGLWAMMDREESKLRRSPFAIRDPALTAYLEGVVRRLSEVHSPDIRIHVVRTPLFNASMAPNGMMQVWSGLLLRCENEAQLAAILGHELGHYLERHSLERLRGMKDRAALAQFFGLFGAVGALGQLGVLANSFAFSREHEVRADQIGMTLMTRAGYSGEQAAQVWENLLGELKIKGGKDAGRRSPMMATHPPVESRRDNLLALANAAKDLSTSETLVLNEAEFQRITQPHKALWLEDELKRGQYDESLILLDRMIKRDPDDTQALASRGEVYRLRADASDLNLARQDLERATSLSTAPSYAFRSLGLVHRQLGSPVESARAFEQYLTAAPNASDLSLIKHYLSELRP